MIDKINPNSQFHPYQPMDAKPHAEDEVSGFDIMIDRARSFAQRNPSMVIGSIAALAIGASLMHRR
jgi:hypothetical protein